LKPLRKIPEIHDFPRSLPHFPNELFRRFRRIVGQSSEVDFIGEDACF